MKVFEIGTKELQNCNNCNDSERTDFMLKGKSLTDFTVLYSPNNY